MASVPIYKIGEREVSVEKWDPSDEGTGHFSCSVCHYSFATLLKPPYGHFRVKTEQSEAIVCFSCSEVLGVAAWRIRGES